MPERLFTVIFTEYNDLEGESWSRFMLCTEQQAEELKDALRAARAAAENTELEGELNEFFTLEVIEGRELFDAVSVMVRHGYGLVGWAAEFFPVGEESRKRLVETLNSTSPSMIREGLTKLDWVVD